jgi:Flp pilus assembly protein TadB
VWVDVCVAVCVRIGEMRVWGGKDTNSTEKLFREKNKGKKDVRLLTGSNVWVYVWYVCVCGCMCGCVWLYVWLYVWLFVWLYVVVCVAVCVGVCVVV